MSKRYSKLLEFYSKLWEFTLSLAGRVKRVTQNCGSSRSKWPQRTSDHNLWPHHPMVVSYDQASLLGKDGEMQPLRRDEFGGRGQVIERLFSGRFAWPGRQWCCDCPECLEEIRASRWLSVLDFTRNRCVCVHVEDATEVPPRVH